MPKQFDEREFLIQVRAIPTPSQLKADEADFYCGAFCNLYRVIGDNTYGVPDTDTCSREEHTEWWLAKLILKNYYKRTAHPTISISEMIAEADRFIKEEFKL